MQYLLHSLFRAVLSLFRPGVRILVLLVLLVGLLLLGFGTRDVGAWSGHLPTCSGTFPRDRLLAQFDARGFPASTSYVAGHNSDTSTWLVFYKKDGTMTISEDLSSGSNYVEAQGDAGFTRLGTDNTALDETPTQYTSNYGSYTCIGETRNVAYVPVSSSPYPSADVAPTVCPEGYTGTYPDCVAPVCPSGTSGTPPDCAPVVVDSPQPPAVVDFANKVAIVLAFGFASVIAWMFRWRGHA